MKLFSYIILLSLVSIFCSAQQNTYFNDTIHPFDSGVTIFRTVCEDDSFFYIGGASKTQNTGAISHFSLHKIDKNGQIVKQRMYVDTLVRINNYPFNSMIVKDDKIIVCFQIDNDTNYVINGSLYILNKHSLDTICTKKYTHPDPASIITPSDDWSDFTAIKATPDGGYILAGNFTGNGNAYSYLRKVDSLGNTQWVKPYNNVVKLFDIELHENGFVFLHKFGYKVNKIAFTDSVGNIIHEKLITSGYTGTILSSLARGENSNYVGLNTWKFSTVPVDRYGIIVYKYDYNTNQVLWEKTFRMYFSIEFLTLHPALGVDVLPDSSIIVSGTLMETDAGRKGFIMKLSSNGDSLWTRTYDQFPQQHNNDFQINDLLPTQDGGFIGVGFIWDQNGDYAAWMFKVDANGLYTNIIAPTSHTQLQSIKCYPNPASDKTKLVFSESLENNSQLQFYNMLGQKVMEYQIDKGILVKEIDLSDLNNGQYLYLLSDKYGVIGTGKLIVEK